MSDDRRETLRRQRDGELVLQTPLAFSKRQSNILEVLEQRHQPRRRTDVKKRLVDQWKQTLALSSSTARKLVTEPVPAPKPAPRRAPPKPPKPPKPLSNIGRTSVSRIRKESVKETAPEPVVQVAPEPVAHTAPPKRTPRPSRPSRWIPTPPTLGKRLADVAIQTAGTVLLTLAMKASSALAALEDRSPFRLT